MSDIDVWEALSEYFLDNEPNLEHIADVCAKSNFSIRELEHKLHYEVAPVCFYNLLSIAGVWTGFKQEWLNKEINENLSKPFTLSKITDALIYRLLLKRSIQSNWMITVELIIQKRENA